MFVRPPTTLATVIVSLPAPVSIDRLRVIAPSIATASAPSNVTARTLFPTLPETVTFLDASGAAPHQGSIDVDVVQNRKSEVVGTSVLAFIKHNAKALYGVCGGYRGEGLVGSPA